MKKGKWMWGIVVIALAVMLSVGGLPAHRAKFGVDSKNNCTFWFELPVCPNAVA